MNIFSKFYHTIKAWCFALVCTTTLTDYDLMKECPKREKDAVFHNLIIFILQFIFIFTLMSATLHIFLDLLPAMLLSGVISLSVVMMEIRMISSIWNQHGVLADRFQFKDLGLLLIRLSLAFVFATAYAISAELYVFGTDIDLLAKQKNDHRNVSLIEYYENQKQEKKAYMEKNEHSLKTIQEEINQLKDQISLIDVDLNSLANQKIELGRLMKVEELGLEGRPAGKSLKYLEYANNYQSVVEKIEKQQFAKDHLENELTRLTQKYEALSEQLETENRAMIEFDPRLLAAQHRDFEATIPNGLSARFRLLQELKRDPVNGSSYVYFSWVIKIVMMTLELLPLLTKFFFSSASLYLERLLSQTRIQAAELRYKTRKAIDKSFEKVDKHELYNFSGFNMDTIENLEIEEIVAEEVEK
ncbi:DUF4407 domain-containing protein [Ketobacter sp.]|uniref:DUF4407 domain-containing protein n=1 Tax=Ketobacter sp. TaxID=2083498 RepID=UPI0025C21B15|nr:DUF4407 domain-containing protein [Ketobacter sp.]